MSLGDILGTVGVALLLLAFAANSSGRLKVTSWSYQLLNTIGAGLACVASLAIGFIPFVVLEAVWAAWGLWLIVQHNAFEQESL
jgi:hypothetical protein